MGHRVECIKAGIHTELTIIRPLHGAHMDNSKCTALKEVSEVAATKQFHSYR